MIVQFSHNGQELNLSPRSKNNGVAYQFDENSKTTGWRYWNNESSHKRKFIRSAGWYLENTGSSFCPTPKKGDLFFWGEWEPQSLFELTGNKFDNKLLPHAVHFPRFSPQGIGKHNTDPFVFGDSFYYTNCKQYSYPFLRDLPQGSVIVFGSEINRSDFVIDTVFVVNSKEQVKDYKLNPEKYPEILRKATIDLHGGLPDHLQLYQGKMYDFDSCYSDSNPYIFSFVPCKVNCDATGFARPIISWQKFNLKKPGAGTVTKRIVYSSDSEFWHDLIADLIQQGFSLGVKIDMPSEIDTVDFPKYKIETSNCGGNLACVKKSKNICK